MIVSRKRHVLWASSYQGVSLVLNVVRGIILVPLYLKYIPITEYGFWVVLRSTIGWLFIIDPGFAELVRARTARYLGAGTIDQIWNDGLVALFLNFILGLIILVAALATSFFLPQILGLSDAALIPRLTHAFFILVAGMLLMLFAYVAAGINDGLQQGAQTGAALAISNIVSIVVSVFGLLHGWGVYALAISYIVLPVAYLTIVTGIVVWNLHRIGAVLPARIEGFRAFASESSVNFRARIASLASNSIDRWLVARFLGPEVVVSYDMMKRVPETCFGMMTQFPHALAPSLSHLAGAGQPQALARWATRLLTLLSVGCLSLGAVIVALNRDFIGLWVGSNYYPSFQADAALILWIAFAALINSTGVLLVAVGHVRASSKILMLYSGFLLPCLLLGIASGHLNGFTLAGAGCAVICVLWKLRHALAEAYCLEEEQKRQLMHASGLALVVGAAVVAAAQGVTVNTWPLLLGKGAAVMLAIGALLLTFSAFLRFEFAAGRAFLSRKNPFTSPKP